MLPAGVLAAVEPVAGLGAAPMFESGAPEAVAELSGSDGAEIAAREPTASVKSSGVFTEEARLSSFEAGAKPSCEASARKCPAGSAGNSKFPLSSVQVTQAFPVEVSITRSVAPGRGVPSAVRRVPASCESAGTSVSPGVGGVGFASWAASGTQRAASSRNSPASSAEILRPRNVLRPFEPSLPTPTTKIPPGGHRGSNIRVAMSPARFRRVYTA